RCSPGGPSTSTHSWSTTGGASRWNARAGSPCCSRPKTLSRRSSCSPDLLFLRGSGAGRRRRGGGSSFGLLRLGGRGLSVAGGVGGIGRAARAIQIAVPAAAFELEGVAAHDLGHLSAALRASFRWRVAQFLQALDDAPARFTDEFVDRHRPEM